MTVVGADERASGAPGDGQGQRRRRLRVTPVDCAVLALVGAVVSASLSGYGLYKTVTYPGLPSQGHVKLVEHFQWFGAIAFFFPLLAVTVALSALAVLLIRGRPTVGHGARPWTAVGRRWIRVSKGWTTSGYVPGLLVAAVVGAADQLIGRPLSLSTAVGSGIGMAVFGAAWLGLRRRSAPPSRVQPGRVVAVIAVVAALVSAGAITRVQDQDNLALWDQTKSPISTGFHTVTAKSLPGVEIFLPTCANASDCVAIGRGSGYDSNPWRMWGLLGTTTDGGASWTVKAIPDATVGRAHCSSDTCSMDVFYGNTRADLEKVTFEAAGTISISQHSFSSSLQTVGAPICTTSHCLGFTTKLPGVAENKALYSDDSGTTWSSTALPSPPPLGARAPVVSLYGPWCSTALNCHGAYVVETSRCTQPDVTSICTQVTMMQTLDGGRTWSKQSNPINDPPSGITNLAFSLGVSPDLS